ncbi:RHS repeat-associated core domain-containing protein [Tenacibaculum maritimum]|nr:RHS repeat-associated core domain-containing protein [Tenacibaculum maritimum]MDB0601965.1 RHS repeat-associated core domain-containing protein [Tenacibaculum maritimum]MDB0613895.1 RHS repeat-associated core domain-containing protein [Tenacibaculum maritimum]
MKPILILISLLLNNLIYSNIYCIDHSVNTVINILTPKKTNLKAYSNTPFRYQGQYEDIETGLYYNRFRYYSPDTGTYISQDPIGLLGNNPNFYAYVHDVNIFVDKFGLTGSLGAIQQAINSVLESHLPQIQAIDPNATIGYRGSAASGISKAHDPSIARAINPSNFDVDAFIQSDYLANDPVFTNRSRDGNKIKGMGDIENSIDKKLREAFPNNKFKGEKFGFRIFGTWELDDMARKGDIQVKLKCH